MKKWDENDEPEPGSELWRGVCSGGKGTAVNASVAKLYLSLPF